MNDFLAEPIYTTVKGKPKRLLTKLMLLFCAIPVLLNCVLVAPLRVILASNVTSSEILGQVLIYLGDFLDLTAFSVSYALIIFSVLLLTKKHSRFVIIFYTLMYIANIPLKILMNIPLEGTLGSALSISLDLFYLLFYFALTMLQLLIVYIFAVTDSDKFIRRVAFERDRAKKKAKETKESKKSKKSSLGVILDEKTKKELQILPFKKMFDLGNPLLRSAFKMSLVIVGVKLISRILNDIQMGAPTSLPQVLVMIVYYLSDIIYGVIAYFMAMFVFTYAYDKLKLDKNDAENIKEAEDDSPASLI